MMMYGLTITKPQDELKKIRLETVIHAIMHPNPKLKAQIELLRSIREMNPSKYRKRKTELPYFCCAMFSPLIRRKENFTSISSFTLDLDKFSDAGLSMQEVKDRISQNPHIRFVFTTPSGDGLKALFLLQDPCMDSEKYTKFYKVFTQRFADQYNLNDVIDKVTSDVSRATFLSADEDAFQNPQAITLDINDFIVEGEIPNYSKGDKIITETTLKTKANAREDYKDKYEDETLNQIRRKLKPEYKVRKEKNINEPKELSDAIPQITNALTAEDIQVESIRPIEWGKQIRVKVGPCWAEINIFYGKKKGFSVVRTTKSGSQPDLGELAYQIVDSLLNE